MREISHMRVKLYNYLYIYNQARAIFFEYLHKGVPEGGGRGGGRLNGNTVSDREFVIREVTVG